MTIALLATGNEIITGDTLNTNCQLIAHILNSEGLELGLHLSSSDDQADIHACIQFLAQKHNIIIIIGGLGPTSDDRTRFALSDFLKQPLIEFPQALEHIQTYLMHSKLGSSKANMQQTKFPSNATLLPNPNGTALGCYCKHNNTLIVLLPGPPHECLLMFNKHVLPYLQKTEHSNKQLLKWRLFGVAESDIAQRLDDALKDLDCDTGYRLEMPYIECKVKCQPQLVSTVTQIVEPLVKPYIIASIEKKASEQLSDAITKWQVPIIILDDVTGGILQSLIQRPDNYHLLKFHTNSDREATYHFHLQGLIEYWSNHKVSKEQTSVSISYYNSQNDTESSEINTSKIKKLRREMEVHTIPYRSPMVVYSAAEWLSFRLFHIINKLHQRIT